METPNNPISNHRALFLLGALALITLTSAVVPSSWFYVESNRGGATLDLTSVDTIDVVGKSAEGTKPTSWKDITELAFKDQPEILEELKNTPVDEDTLKDVNDETNLTASFSKNLYVASVYLQDNGITDEAAQQEVLNQLI